MYYVVIDYDQEMEQYLHKHLISLMDEFHNVYNSNNKLIRHWLEDYGLRLSALRLPLSRGFDSPEELERRIATTKTAMETAYKLGAFVVLCPIGQVPQDQQSPRWRLLAEVMDELSRHGNRVGAQLAESLASLVGRHARSRSPGVGRGVGRRRPTRACRPPVRAG